MNASRQPASLVLLFSLVFVLSACTKLVRNPVPVDKMDEAQMSGLTEVRAFWHERAIDPVFQQDLVLSMQDEPPDFFPRDENGASSYNGLALSGGGGSGAFGAGILCGWSDSGTRPVFKLVTGISTGALIAPYAFAGEAYDAKLKKVYTSVSTKDIVKLNKRLFSGEALGDSSPLAELIAQDLNETMLKDIAAAHIRGQRLYIGTTNLDAERFVVWNMGAIANSGHPEALNLFRQVMLASASIPGAFPPIYIEVEVDGQTYDEMHVDGGIINQVFFYEFMLDVTAVRKMKGNDESVPNPGTVYVIRNGKTGPERKQMERKIVPIAGRAISSMIKSASINDLFRIYELSKRDNIGFKHTAIPDDFEFESKEAFDREEMNALFDLGYGMALNGSAWKDAPLESSQGQ